MALHLRKLLACIQSANLEPAIAPMSVDKVDGKLIHAIFR